MRWRRDSSKRRDPLCRRSSAPPNTAPSSTRSCPARPIAPKAQPIPRLTAWFELEIFRMAEERKKASPLAAGKKAPAFDLESSTGERIKLADFAEKKTVVLYFYPKADTPGCTK